MLRRFYLITALITALGVGLVAASAQTAQKDKDKEKDKDKTWVAGEAQQAWALSSLVGEGGYLGVFLEEVTPERVKELNLGEERGAIIMKVVKDSPADKAGLKENDVVVAYNGRRIDTMREFQRLLGETPAERAVTIEVIRGGNRQSFSTTLSKRSQSMSLFNPEFNEKFLKDNQEAMKRAEELFKKNQGELGKMPKDFGSYAFTAPGGFRLFRGGRLGIGIESLTPQLGEYFGVKDGQGVLVTEVAENSAASKGGLKAGDVITAIDGEKVDNISELYTALAKKQEGAVTIKVIRNRGEHTVTVMIEKPQTPLMPRTPRAQISVDYSSAF